MQKTIETIMEVKNTCHEFYCDECNEYLGTSYEYEDGWYPKLGEFDLNLNVFGWMHMKKCLCEKCRDKIIDNVRQKLFAIGFEV